MTSLTSDQIRSYIRDGVIIRDEKGIESLKPLVGIYDNDGNLVDAPDVDFIEGGSFDLRLDECYEPFPTVTKILNPSLDRNQIAQQGFIVPALIGIEKRRTPEIRKCDLMQTEDGKVGYAIFPMKYFLVTTVEVLSIPSMIRAFVSSRTTLFRCGLNLITSSVHPNFSGILTFGLSNASSVPVFIERRARIASVAFFYLSGIENDLYEGIWQNGRVSTEMNEDRGY
jgi:deoxycytidine triphosphate deaminase